MRDKKVYFFVGCLVLFLGVSLHWADAPQTARLPLRLALQWLPQSQFAGFYMALDKGIFRDAGFDVTFLHTGPGPSSLDYLVAGQADFATFFLADALVYGREPVLLVQIAQLAQRSNLMLVAWKEMGIKSPADLNGQLISYWSGVFSAAFKAFFHRQGITPIERSQNYSVNLFLNHGVAACAAMEYNELHRIYQAGVDFDRLTLFLMRDYDLGFPEDGLYTAADFAKKNPSVCQAFRLASIAGWEYARQNQEETLDVVLRESRLAGVPANRAHCRWMLEKMLASIFIDKKPGKLGCLDRQTYQKTVKALIETQMIANALPFENFAPLEKELPQ